MKYLKPAYVPRVREVGEATPPGTSIIARPIYKPESMTPARQGADAHKNYKSLSLQASANPNIDETIIIIKSDDALIVTKPKVVKVAKPKAVKVAKPRVRVAKPKVVKEAKPKAVKVAKPRVRVAKPKVAKIIV